MKRILKNVPTLLLTLTAIGSIALLSYVVVLICNAVELTETTPNSGLVDIACALIEFWGIVLAAVIGVGGLKKIAREGFDTYFTSFSSKRHNLKRIINRAEKEVTIVVAYGDNLLKECESLLGERMRQGIKVNFLMLSKDQAFRMSQYYYQEASEKITKGIQYSLRCIEELKKIDNFGIKTWPYPLAASYIAIDCGITSGFLQNDALIQIMIYQYGVPTPEAPITYLSHEKNADIFKRTIDSLSKMWSDAKNFEESGYDSFFE